MKSAIESLLFVSGDEGITYKELKNILNINDDLLKNTLQELCQDYITNDRGIEMTYLGNSIKLVTKKENTEYIKKLVDFKDNETLSNSAIETLAIIAYNQPVTRIDVDEIRGVSSAYLIRKLVYKNLVCEIGRSEIAGRPLLYGTTSMFLDYFGLKDLSELPKIEIETDKSVKDLYNSKYNEEKV